MDKKMISMIVMCVAGVVEVVTLVLLVKWHPIHVAVLIVGAVAGYIGNKMYRQS